MQTNNTLREALANLVDVIDRCDSGSPLWWHGGAKGVVPLKNAKAALADPVKNCEVGTAEEQRVRFEAWCEKQPERYCKACTECPTQRYAINCFCKWSQMPYEGGTKSEDYNSI